MAIGLRFCRHVLNRNRKDVFLSWLNGQLFLFCPFMWPRMCVLFMMVSHLKVKFCYTFTVFLLLLIRFERQ